MRDTIFAVSSGAPPAAIAVLRISGPQALAAASALAGPLPAPRVASLRRLRGPDGEILDRAVVLGFPGPATATGEDCAELQLHGGRAVVRAVSAALGGMAGLRAAEPGEFTRRALENGRLDLTEAEGLADLLAADTESQRRAAIRSAEGMLRRSIESWTDRVLALAAGTEAAIDHDDEEDVADQFATVATVHAGAALLADDIDRIVAQPSVERLRDGIRVVLAGPPNSGKSTLLNAMAGRDVAIVSPIAGTTRDRLEAPLVRNGIAWIVTDTAGLAPTTSDPIEAMGIERARESIELADIVLWLGDAAAHNDNVVLVHARSDAPGRGDPPSGRIAASGVVDGGTDALWAELDRRGALLLPSGDVPTLNRRQRDLCGAAARSLHRVADSRDLLVIAEELRSAMAAFDRLTGRADTEAVLDSLFASFCIGK